MARVVAAKAPDGLEANAGKFGDLCLGHSPGF